MGTPGDSWTDDELRDAVLAYLEMKKDELEGRAYKKSDVYDWLAKKHGRSAKSFEYRMQNVSAVLDLTGETWVPGLRPAKNVGTHVAERIQKILQDSGLADLDFNAGFELQAQNLRASGPIPRPLGVEAPPLREVSRQTYVRDATVKAWVLQQANGVCEACGIRAPFESSDGFPFLEVHHVIYLAEGGGDTVENAVAVCPNCHRAFHHAEDRQERRAQIYQRVKRLARRS